MNKGSELAKNTAVIAIGKIATQMVSFFLLPLYTAVLSTEDYGIVDLVTTYAQLLLPIVTLQLEQALFRFLLECRTNENEKKKTISEICTLTIFATCIFCVIYFVACLFVPSQFKYLLLLNLVASVFVAMMLQTARGLGFNSIYAEGSFISASGQVALNVVFVLLFRMGAYGMLYASFLAYLISGIYLLFRTKVYKYFHFTFFSLKEVKPFLKYSLPLIPNVISWWILNASDRTIILKFIGISANGIYSAANKFSGIYTNIYNIFNLSWTETVALHLHENGADADFTKLQSTIIRFFSSMYIGITAVMPFVFSILINDKFGDAYYQIPILLAGAFFSAMTGVLGAYYVAEKMTDVIAKMTITAAIFNVAINLLFVKTMGLYAASLSTLISYFVVFVLRYIDVRKRFNIRLKPTIVIGTVVMTVMVWVAYYSRNVVWCAIALVVTVVYAVVMNCGLMKNIMNTALRFVRKR